MLLVSLFSVPCQRYFFFSLLSELPLGIDWRNCREDNRDGTAFGSLPPRGRYTGCRPWPPGLFVQQDRVCERNRIARSGRAETNERIHHVSVPRHEAGWRSPGIRASIATKHDGTSRRGHHSFRFAVHFGKSRNVQLLAVHLYYVFEAKIKRIANKRVANTYL